MIKLYVLIFLFNLTTGICNRIQTLHIYLKNDLVLHFPARAI